MSTVNYKSVTLNSITLRLAYNVRRYVALAQDRGGMCFCRYAAM